MNDVEALIVGAGPTGLALAAELSRFGVSHRLVDRVAHPARWSQALVVQARTLEQFERYGIAEAAVARGRKLRTAAVFSSHRLLLKLDLSKIRSAYPFMLILPQSETERLLSEHLTQRGVRIERETEMAEYRQDDEGVEVSLQHGGTTTERVRASWLIGCDGAHSTVRRLAGIPFEGTAVDDVFFLGDLRISGSELPEDQLRAYLNKGNVVFIARITESIYRFIVALHAEQGPADGAALPLPDVTLDDFQRAIDAHADSRFRVSDPEWMARFRINQRRAARYRHGRVFLAGDACHIHSPVGGQGMNTGIQDAANIGWKIAAVSRGAPVALMESYEGERGPVGEALVAATSRALAALTTENPVLGSLRDHAMGLIGHLPVAQDRARGFVSETGIQYRSSPIVKTACRAGALHAGDRAPDATYRGADGRENRLYETLSLPQHTLLLLNMPAEEANALSARWPAAHALAVRISPGDSLAAHYAAAGEAVVYAIRPDGYIGFRGGRGDHAALRAYAEMVGADAPRAGAAA